MRRSLTFLTVLLFIGFCCTLAAQTVVEGRYIVRFNPDTDAVRAQNRADTIAAKKAALEANLDLIVDEVKSPAVTNVEKLWIINGVALTAPRPEIIRIEMLDNVKEVIPVTYEIFVDLDLDTQPVEETREIQWGVERVNAPKVWNELEIDGAGVVVGVLDTGIHADHPLLEGKTIYFKDFTRDGFEEPHDGQGHGTHVAGSIAARGGVGVAPAAKFIIARVFNSSGGTTTDTLLNAMQWMMDPKEDSSGDGAPRVINNSWGSNSTTNRTFWDAVQSWVDVDILPVFAAGNNGMWGGRVGTPAAFPHSWAVAATTVSDTRASFSSIGPANWDGETLMKPDIAAPGHQIISCNQSDGLVSNSGTSMAAPHVAGVIALMLQADPSLTIEQMRLLTEEEAIHLGQEGKNTHFGSGLIDAYASVKRVLRNAHLASSYEAYESALRAEKAFVGVQIDSPLVTPLAESIIKRTAELDDGEFASLSISVNEMSDSAQQLLKEAAAYRTANQIYE